MVGDESRQWTGRMIDAHVHVGRSLFGHEVSVDSLLESMVSNAIYLAVLVPFKPPGYHFGPENDRIAETVRQYPGRFAGFARVDPWQRGDALLELQRSIEDLELQGLYLHPYEELFTANDELVFPLVEMLRERSLPLMLAGGYPGVSHPSQIGDLARQFPDVTIIATHGGQLNISGLLLADATGMLRANPNVIIETSGIYREDFIEDIVKELGPGRVEFGSNAPYMDQSFEALRVRLAHLSASEKEEIASKGMERILGLHGANV